jgi:hypothetical protein
MTIEQGFRKNIKAVARQSGAYPYLMSFISVLFFILIFLAFSILNLNLPFYFLILAILVFAGLCFLAQPFMYGVSLAVSEGCRFKGRRKWSLDKLFNLFFRSNPGAYGLGMVVWRSFLAFFLATLVGTLLVMAVLSLSYPSLINELQAYLSKLNSDPNGSADLWTYLGDDRRNFEIIIIVLESFAALITLGEAGIELRRNEDVFYCASSLVTDNHVNIATSGLVGPFRKSILPTVRKEHVRLTIHLFWPAYALFFSVFLGLMLLGIFLPSIPYYLVAFIAFAGGLLSFTPFYYWERVFDDLFYIAYQDKIMERLSLEARQFIEEGRKAMRPLYSSVLDKEDQDSPEADSASEAKKGDVESDGTVDFTKGQKPDEPKGQGNGSDEGKKK